MELKNRESTPCLVFQHGRRERSQTFINMEVGSHCIRSIKQMRNKDVWLSFRGWLLLRDTSGRFCLFDTISLTEIEVPHLPKEHRDCIFVLSAMPTEPDCQLILFNTEIPVIYNCRIAEDNEFYEARCNLIDKNDSFHNAISCKDKIYFRTFRGFGVIDYLNNRPILRFLLVQKVTDPLWYAAELEHFLVESCGEIFLVRQIFYWTKHMVSEFFVFKMDFSKMRWVTVKTIGKLVFFLSKNGTHSCSAFESGIKGDQIFFFLKDDISLYAYQVKERSISVDLTPNVQPPWKMPFWVVQTSDKVKADMEKMGHVKVDMQKMQLPNSNEKADIVKMAKKTTQEKIFIDAKSWSDLPVEIVKLIAMCLTPVAYACMRSTCYNWRSTVPLAWLPQTPCLFFYDGIDGLCKFFDPLTSRVYAADIPELHGATFHCSKGNWLLASYDDSAAFFFNPFTKERITLPDSYYLVGHCSTMSFSSVPTSPDCVVFSVCNFDPFDNISIYTCSPGAHNWHSYEREEVHPLFLCKFY